MFLSLPLLFDKVKDKDEFMRSQSAIGVKYSLQKKGTSSVDDYSETHNCSAHYGLYCSIYTALMHKYTQRWYERTYLHISTRLWLYRSSFRDEYDRCVSSSTCPFEECDQLLRCWRNQWNIPRSWTTLLSVSHKPIRLLDEKNMWEEQEHTVTPVGDKVQ